MYLIGENLNVINRVIGKAFKEKDPGPIVAEAKLQKEKGMDWIDINLGPARKGGPELMEFVVKSVQDAIGDSPPLCLDTSNIEAIQRRQALITQSIYLDKATPLILKILQVFRIIELEG